MSRFFNVPARNAFSYVLAASVSRCSCEFDLSLTGELDWAFYTNSNKTTHLVDRYKGTRRVDRQEMVISLPDVK